jgi:hypothetical protein
MFIGPGTLNMGGPSGASATLGSDQNGIAFTANGFATPFINIGPNINAIDEPGAIGGWVLAPTGDLTGPDYDLIVQRKLPGAAVPAGLTGPVFSLIKNPTFTGPTGIQGQNGITGGLTLFFDTAGGTYSATPISGTLQTIPTQTAQTTIVYSGGASNIQVASFITPVNQIVSPIVAGLWSVNLYALSDHGTRVSCYATISSVDADGTSNKTLIVSGSAGPINIPDVQGVYTQDLFVPTTTLAAGKRIIIDLYVNNSSGNNSVIFEFRDSTLSHIHTTIIGNVATGPTGPIGPTGPAPVIPTLTTNGYNTATVSPTLTVDDFILKMDDTTKYVQIATVTGTINFYWSGTTVYWSNPTAAIVYSSGSGTVAVTTTFVNIDRNGSPTGIGSGGDTMTFTLQDTTNSRVYQVIATKTAGSGCVFAVNRYV